MLVIFTGYDQVSKILRTCAIQLARKADSRIKVNLGPPLSSADSIRKVLAEQKDMPLFWFGHGDLPPEGLIGQDQVSAVHSKNLNLLKNRLVVASSCYSAQSLAGAARKHGATIIGYHGEFMISHRPEDRAVQNKCILAAAMALLAGGDAASAHRAAVAEFDKAATKLIGGTADDGQIASAVYSVNAQAIRLAGKNRKM